MRRLAPVDWLLLGTTLPIFVLGLVMSVIGGIRGDFVIAPVLPTSAPGPQSYPVVKRILSSVGADGFAVGDRLVRLEGSDLRGVSTAGFMLRWSRAAQTGARSMLLTIERRDTRSDVHMELVPGNNCFSVDPPWWAAFPSVVAGVGTALLLLVRAPHWHLARRYYVVSILFAFFFMPYFTVPTAPRVEIFSDVLMLPLAQGLYLWSLSEFLPGLRLWSPRQRALVCILALLQSASSAAEFWLPDPGVAAISIGGLVGLGVTIAFLVTMARVYQRADSKGRRQIKWVIYGVYVALLPSGPYNIALSLGIAPDWIGALATVWNIALVAAPLGLLVAVAFYQFLDIDRLFSATLSYSILAVLGVAMVLGVVPAASRAVSDTLGFAPFAGQVLVSLGLAALLVPVHRAVTPWVDQRLFPARATLEQGFERLLEEISHTSGIDEAAEMMVERLDALLQPSLVLLYARTGDLFAPLAVRGRSASPAFAARSALIAALQERTTPLAAKRWTARQAASLGPFERAAIETLDVAVLVPIRRGTELAAFCCLGPKRDGDIYTASDLALLGAVAAAISDRLLVLNETPRTRQPPPSLLLGKEEAIPALSETMADSPIEGSAPEPQCVFQQEGEYWTLAYHGKTARLRTRRAYPTLRACSHNLVAMCTCVTSLR